MQKKTKHNPYDTKNEDKKLADYLDAKTNLLQKQYLHQPEQLVIKQKKMRFDERRLLVEETRFEGNFKKDIEKHNMEMLKMRK